MVITPAATGTVIGPIPIAMVFATAAATKDVVTPGTIAMITDDVVNRSTSQARQSVSYRVRLVNLKRRSPRTASRINLLTGSRIANKDA